MQIVKYMKFIERLNEEIKTAGIKQAELARRIGIGKQTLSLYCKGTSYPSLEVLYLHCIHLDVSADYLLGLTDDYWR